MTAAKTYFPVSPKAKIISAGLSVGNIASAAKLSSPCASQNLSGQRRNHKTQIAIWDAFRVLTGSKISLEQFWGEQLSQRLRSHDNQEHAHVQVQHQSAKGKAHDKLRAKSHAAR